MDASRPKAGIMVGSPNDLEKIQEARDILERLGIPYEVRVLSAHRTPELTADYVKNAEERGLEILVACAGLAAHLAGTVAAYTRLPVIGVPLASGALSGLDSLLSTVQMPTGVPVATVAVDGVKNAAFLAGRILAIKHPEIREQLDEAMTAMRKAYEKDARDE